MPRVLTADVWWQVAQLTSKRKQLELVRLSKDIYDVVIPTIYRNLDIGRSAIDFVHSLANNSRLPPLVHVLCFHNGAFVNDAEWAAALRAMKNLKFLYVNLAINFPLDILPDITFSLTTFGSRCSVFGSWATLIASQPTIGELKLNDDYYQKPPGPDVLPALHAVKGRPADLARFARQHALEDMWFFSGPPHGRRSLKRADLALFAQSPSRLVTVLLGAAQFLLLVRFAPSMMATLRHVVLDEDPDWSEFTRNPELAVVRGNLAEVARKINGSASHLQSMLLAFSQNVSDRHPAIRPLLRADGEFFLNSFNAITPTPHFKTFRVYASDGCTTWEKWGSTDQTTSYLPPPPDCGPLDLEADLQYLFGRSPLSSQMRLCLSPQEESPIIQDRPRQARCVYVYLKFSTSSYLKSVPERTRQMLPPPPPPLHSCLTARFGVYAARKRMEPLPRFSVRRRHLLLHLHQKEAHAQGAPDPGNLRPGENPCSSFFNFPLCAMFCSSKGPQRKKKKRCSLLPRPTPPVLVPPQEPRRPRHHSVPTPQESAKRAAADLNPEAEASWQEAFSILPNIVLQWAAGTLPTGDESDNAEDPEIPDLPHLMHPNLAEHPDLPDILLTPAEVAECRQTFQTDGEAAETYRLAPRRPRRRLEDLLTPAQREDRHQCIRAQMDQVRALRRQQVREREEAWELEREARLPGLRRVIVDAMRPWERQDFLRVELEQERREEDQPSRETASRRPFDNLNTITYVE
ncbi:hypothetical protein B0H16DRAFT_1463200 [Mycena metata]|uniref:Uncharacterized protein n=1 Tax=Mycena metata TaxID=1033252 RepID=A0AAD7IKK6_9AGAR|nr:hypothetical protein B0H16DRAFT_1463200 [Mycena metata]